MRAAGTTTLVLASASPARRALLNAAGIDPQVVVSGVDESVVREDSPQELCLTLARMKATEVARRLPAEGISVGPGGRLLVLGCDSVLEFEGAVYGKPTDSDDATKRWRRMRGRSGVLHTGHYLIDLAGVTVGAVGSTVVHFAELTDDEIAAYVGTGEPLHVAGAFTIDGLGGPFVERIEGDHGTVVGLSLPLLRHLLDDLGVRLTDLWKS
ncbi:Maf family protein [Asanoa sp. WMMD1127]|uniref:nucleoside triphosphate pyrophosphatase n=1 Tax=Asanoa sp. WMMD1127 TaxID=3016107 RepID=UPI0024177682|nr:nucleoside triphosphate pyrophosphatase [Asanoa sp. WMMD1127]MDG4822829.1 Maf family protein [Asanoa sp. WMMD1127]